MGVEGWHGGVGWSGVEGGRVEAQWEKAVSKITW